MGLSRRERREQRRKLLKDERLQQLSVAEISVKKESHSKHRGLLHIYDAHYKKLLILPILLFVLAIIGMAYQVATTGDFINKGVSLKGGVVISIPVNQPVPIPEVEKILKQSFPQDDIEVRSTDEFGVQKAIIITTDHIGSENAVIDALSPLIPDAKSQASSETTGASLGGGFFKQTVLAMIIAFVFMALVVFISFKTFVPSMAVITCAFADILETIVFVDFLGLKVSTAGIAAFLMLIGYSVDTDILLTSRVLRGKEGSVFDRTLSATKTGLLMTTTTIVAVVISLLVTQSTTITEIMTIMLVGLIFDIINTWLQNTAILRFYMEHRKTKQGSFKKEVEPEIIDTDYEVIRGN
jgi:preprotein translocase subunit SecF